MTEQNSSPCTAARPASADLQRLFRLAALAPVMAAALAGCGGGGGGGDSGPPPPPPPPPPPAISYNLSGTISVAPNAAVDSDINDVSQDVLGEYVVNDFESAPQLISAPVLLAGTVNEIGAGPDGNNRDIGDTDDTFRVDLVAGQTIELEFASDPADSDVDLYVYSADSGTLFGASEGVDTRYECVTVTASGSFFVNVYAFRNASIYNMRIGAPGSASSCPAATSASAVASAQLLAKARSVDAALAAQAASKLQAAAVRGAVLGGSGARLPHLLQLPATAAERQRALSLLAGNAARRSIAAAPAAGVRAENPVPDSATRQRADLMKFAKRVQATGAFAYVQPNWVEQRHATVGEFPPDDRFYPYQRWHYEQINLPAAMSRITGLTTQPTQRPVVAVIDDGVVLDHPDLAPQLFSPGRAFISRNSAGDGNAASGDNTATAADEPIFHGTHVAGTAAASSFDGLGGAGTAPMAQILPLRVFPPRGGAGQVDVINAMLYAARLANNSGTLPARRADVINLSLGSDRACDAAYTDAIAQVRAAGVIVVAAAGNSGQNPTQRAAVGAPANCAGAVAVSALDAREQVTPYSNTGAQIAVAAPGGDVSQSTTGSGAPDGIYSDVATFDPDGTRQPAFGVMQGTSMAAPHVAGVMALMRYVNPALTVAQVDALLASGALTDDRGTAGRDIDYGFGLINARKAVDAALGSVGTPDPVPAGVVVASPSSLDFGSFQSVGVLDLVATAQTAETVQSVVSNSGAVSVAATTVDGATGLGRYTVTVNRAALAEGTSYPTLTVTLNPARTITVQLSVTKPGTGGGSASAGYYGPIYVLLIDPATGDGVATVLATRTSGAYTWSYAGYDRTSVAIVAGGDLDNDNFLCQRGEACGAYPVLAPGGDISVVELTGNRSGLNFQVAPLSGMSVQSAGSGAAPGLRRTNAAGVPARDAAAR